MKFVMYLAANIAGGIAATVFFPAMLGLWILSLPLAWLLDMYLKFQAEEKRKAHATMSPYDNDIGE